MEFNLERRLERKKERKQEKRKAKGKEKKRKGGEERKVELIKSDEYRVVIQELQH